MSRLNKLMNGVGWGSASTLIVTGLQLVFMGVMARLLDPVDFGLVAIAGISLRFFQYFAQLGVQPALIRKEQLDDGDVRAALIVSLGFAALFFLLVLFAAPFFERFFQMQGLTLIIQVLALNFLINGFSAVSIGLMYRHTMFNSIAMMTVAAYVLGYGVLGLGAAFLGFGVWALVIATLAQITISAIWAYIATQHPVGMQSSRAQKRYFFGYGGKYSIIGFMEFLTSFLGELIVGKLFGAAAAGLYNRANLIALMPVQQPIKIVRQSLFPILCSLHGDDREKYHNGILYAVLLVGGFSLAVSIGIAMSARDIVGVLLGDKWTAAVPVLQVLAFLVPLRSTTEIMSLHFEAANELGAKMIIQSVMLITLLVGLYVLHAHGLQWIAVAVLLSEAVRFALYLLFLVQRLPVSIREWGLVFGIFALTAAVAAGCMYLITGLLPLHASSALKLPFEIIAGMVSLVLAGVLAIPLASQLPANDYLLNKYPRILRKVGWRHG